jgi:hypothetical protein
MPNKIQVKRSSVPSKVPTTSDIDLGEIAINTYDGKMYIKKDDGTASVVEIGSGGGGAETDPIVGAVNGIVKADGSGNISAATAGTDYLVTAVTSATAGTGISVSASTGSVTISNTAPDQTVVLNAGTGISTSGTYPNFTIAATNNGTVTSVGGTGTVNGITLSGTVTSSGSLTLGGTLSNVSLTTQVTGTLPVGNGGTGATSLTANNVLLGNGTSALQVVAPGTTGNVLTSNGTTWVSSAPAASGGATGGGSDKIFYENDQEVTTDYTITTNKNAMTAGPVTINSTITVTVPSGSTWTIV